MPNRIIREGILDSERVDQLDAETEVFYRRVLNVVDDYGRFDARPAVLIAACYPLRAGVMRADDVERMLGACSAGDRPLIRAYTVGGKRFLEVQDFRQQVRSNRSKYPAICEADEMHSSSTCTANEMHSSSTCTANATQTHSVRTPYSETKTKTNAETDAGPPGGGRFVPNETFSKLWNRHPKKRDRILAEQALAETLSTRPDDPAGLADQIDRSHAAWCSSPDWNKENGRFAPKLSNWLRSGDWTETPTEENGHPRELSMAEQDRLIAEYQAAKAARRG